MIYQLKNNARDLTRLTAYLQLVDKDFEISLSSKIALSEYASKILQFGHIFVITTENDEILSCIGFYCNDMTSKIAYLSFLSTIKQASGKGYARILVKNAITFSKDNDMQKIYCDSINPIAIQIYKSIGFRIYHQEFQNSYTKSFLELKI